MPEEIREEYYRIIEDGKTVCFYFNVFDAAADGSGVKHDAGAEIKISDWINGKPTKEQIEMLLEKYKSMSDSDILMIGNCRAKIVTTTVYEAMYGFLDDGSFVLVSDEYHADDKNNKEPGPIDQKKRVR